MSNRTNEELAPDEKGHLARTFAAEVVKRLRDAGFQAMWAGGCVRDLLRGVAPQDYDVATDATPDQVEALFGRRRTLAVGAQFGVMIVLGRNKSQDGQIVKHQVEVATFRRDADYADGRHPTSVEYSSPQEDALRRDFTINGLFLDPMDDQVIDYVEGQRDLQRRLVRAIGNADDRFDEDKLRMLRAVRFASTLDFELDAETQAAITARPTELIIVSAERIAAELRKILLDKNRATGLALLRETGLLSVIFPETDSPTFQRNWATTRQWLGAIQSPDFSECLALVFRAAHEDAETATNALTTAARRQKLTNRESHLATWLIANEATIEHAETEYWPTLQRLLLHDDIEHLLRFAATVHSSDSQVPAGVAFCQAKLALAESVWNPAPLLDGTDLRDHGVPSGAIYRRILDAVRDAQLLGQCDSREAALAIADRIVAEEQG